MTAYADETPHASCDPEQEKLRQALAAARGTVLDLRSHLADLRAGQEFLRQSYQRAASEAQKRQAQATAAEAEIAEMTSLQNSLFAERDWLRDVKAAQESRLGELEPIAHRVSELTNERNTLARKAATLDRLASHLRWDDGPRSLRVILPLARLARRLVRG